MSPDPAAEAKLIFGCGYLGLRVARLWLAEGAEVWAVTRSPERARELARQGIRPMIADVLRPETLTQLPDAATVLVAVSYGRDKALPLVAAYTQGIANITMALRSAARRLIYISSTGVYGGSDGAWVDEISVCQPGREGGRACLAAEEHLRAGAWAARTIILRLAGIYGPGRLPQRAAIVAGEPLAAPATGHLNLIHVVDAARVVLAAEARAPLPSLYCISDGHPVVRREYYHELARLLGVADVRLVPPAEEAPAALRATSDKRIANGRMLRELGVDLQFASYREGLAASIREEQPGA